MIKVPILTIAILYLASVLSFAENRTEGSTMATLYGSVTSTEGVPLDGALIYVHETGASTLSDSSGNYILADFMPGSYHIHIYMIGYKSTARTVRISGKTRADFILQASVLELGEVVIESSPFRMEEKKQSVSIDVIRREELQRHSTGSFAGSLDFLPGLSTISMGAGIAKPVIRSQSAHRIALVDRGIKQEGQQWGSDHGLEIDQFDVDRVEVIKGPATLLYGSDAGGGVINISTPAVPPLGTIRSSVLSTYRSNNEMIAASAMAEGNLDGKNFRFRFSEQSYANYQVPADTFLYGNWLLPIYEQELKNTAGRERNISSQFGLNKNWGSVQLSLSRFKQEAGLFPGAFSHPGSYSLQHTTDSREISKPKQETEHWKAILNSRFLFRENWIEVDLGFQRNIRSEIAEPHTHGHRPLPESDLHLFLELDTYTANLRYYANYNDEHRGIFGLSSNYKNNRIGGFEFLIPEYDYWDAGLFGFHKYRYSDELILNAGLRFDYHQIDIERFTEDEYAADGSLTGELERNSAIQRNYFNTSANAGLSWMPLSTLNLKLNIGSHYRVPQAAELASNGFHHGTFRHESGDASLNPEKGVQFDFAFAYQTNDFLFRITPFYNRYLNYIYLMPTAEFSLLPGGGQVYRYVENPVLITGSEIMTEYHLFDNLHLGLGLEYVYTENLNTGLALPLTPPASAIFEVEYKLSSLLNERLKNTFINTTIRAFNKQHRVDRNERETPEYMTLSASLGTRLIIAKQAFDIAFKVQNLTNETYLNHMSRYRLLNLPEAGRNYIFTLYVPLGLYATK